MSVQRLFLGFIVLLMAMPILLYAAPAYAKKSFWDAMLGPWMREMERGPKPEQTLQAPFADDPYKINNRDQVGVHTLVPVTQPHMDPDNVGKWVMTAVAEALTFNLDDTEEMLAAKKEYFTDGAWRQAMSFKESLGFNKVMESGQYNVHSFTQRPPLLLNSLEHQGRFRWLFEVPVMMSAIGAGDFNYKENDATNQDVVVVVQVGRYPPEENKDGLLIESFKGRTGAQSE